MRQLTERGWQALVDHGVRTILDLRHHEEVAADPLHEPPVAVIHVPLFPDPASPAWPELDAIGRAAGPGAPGTRAIYGELLRRFPERFATAVSAVGRAPDGGVVIHCVAGKDRTGLVTALLLRLAGVPRGVVGADYAVTAENLRERAEQWIAEARDDEEREFRRRLSDTPAEAMVGVLEDLEDEHGTVRDYLLSAGAPAADVAAARSRLRD